MSGQVLHPHGGRSSTAQFALTDIGLLVTTEGFTPAAKRRAKGVRGMWLDVVPYEDLADWKPDLEWCHICTDLRSDDFPGGVYMQQFDRRNLPLGGDLSDAVGRCERCQTFDPRFEKAVWTAIVSASVVLPVLRAAAIVVRNLSEAAASI